MLNKTILAEVFFINNGMIDDLPLFTFICPICGERHYSVYGKHKKVNFELGEYNVYNYTNKTTDCNFDGYEFVFKNR